MASWMVGAYAVGFGLLMLFYWNDTAALQTNRLTQMIFFAFILIFMVRVLVWADKRLEQRA